LLTWLKERNDLVLVDGPSLDDQADLSRIAPLSDALFLVMPHGEPAAQTRGSIPATIIESDASPLGFSLAIAIDPYLFHNTAVGGVNCRLLE